MIYSTVFVLRHYFFFGADFHYVFFTIKGGTVPFDLVRQSYIIMEPYYSTLSF